MQNAEGSRNGNETVKAGLIDIGRLIPYARNPRRNEAAIAKVAASIKEYGFRQPIVVDEDMAIIAGHTRLQAAQQPGRAYCRRANQRTDQSLSPCG